jgi:hypothetical protein
MRLKLIQAFMDEEQVIKLKKMAQADKRSLSNLMRTILEEYINKKGVK